MDGEVRRMSVQLTLYTSTHQVVLSLLTYRKGIVEGMQEAVNNIQGYVCPSYINRNVRSNIYDVHEL